MLNDKQQPFDIWRYLAVLQRRRYLAIVTGLAVLSIFTWGSFLMPKVYEANSTISIEKGSVINPLMQGIGVSNPMEERLNNLKAEITSRGIIEKVVKKLGMQTAGEDPAAMEALVGMIRQNLTVGTTGGPNLYTISYKSNDPKLAFDVVNAVTSEYIAEHRFSKKTDVFEAYEFIESQLLEYKKKLEESDAAIREFREKNPKLIIQSEGTLLTRLEGLQSQKIETDIRMQELLRKRDNLKKQLSGEKELTVAIVTRDDSPQARLNHLNNQLMLLMTKYTENYPEVIKVKSEIEELKRQIARAKESPSEGSGAETSTLNPIYQQLREELARTDAEIESLGGRLSEISRQQQESQKILGQMPKEQEQWTKLQRDRNVYQQIYDQLLQKLEQARVSKDLELSEKGELFRIMDSAKMPLFPVKPNRVRMILLGLFLGLASGIGIVFAREYFDHSFRDEESVSENLKLPVLATIPTIVTDAEEAASRRTDRKVYLASGAYLLVIGLVFFEEFIWKYLGIKLFHF